MGRGLLQDTKRKVNDKSQLLFDLREPTAGITLETQAPRNQFPLVPPLLNTFFGWSWNQALTQFSQQVTGLR